MTCKTETKTIGEREFSVTQWSAEKALLMKLKLLKVIGPSVASLASNSDGNEVEAFAKGLEKLFQNSEPEQILDLIKQCLVGVAIDGTRLTESRINENFDADSLMDMYQVFLFVLKTNYGNFMKGQLAQKLVAKMEGET